MENTLPMAALIQPVSDMFHMISDDVKSSQYLHTEKQQNKAKIKHKSISLDRQRLDVLWLGKYPGGGAPFSQKRMGRGEVWCEVGNRIKQTNKTKTKSKH